jgi:UDP-N-acetylmuramate-alanine ligase
MKAMAGEVLSLLEEGDLVLTLGAGNIVGVGEQLLDLLRGN